MSELGDKRIGLRRLLEQLEAEFLKNLVSDNRLGIAQCFGTIINTYPDMHLWWTNSLRDRYKVLASSLEEHMRRHP